MIKTMISSLAVALVTGLTYLAFTDHPVYKIISLWVALVSTTITFLFFVWSLGAASIPRKLKHTDPMAPSVYSLGIWLLFMMFLAALYFLPAILGGAK
jgi:hypothetical protein